MRVGELEIEGGICAAHPKLVKAAAALAFMHELFDELVPLKYPGRSKDSCILSALTARDFLQRIGYRDARCEPVYVMVRAFRDEVDVWSVGVGDHAAVHQYLAPGSPPPKSDFARHGPTGRGWDGHLVVEVPSAKVFIDPTLCQCQRPVWPSLPGMVMAATDDQAEAQEVFPRMLSMGMLAGTEDDGTRVIAAWIRQPWNNSWKQAPDAVNKANRRPVVAELHRRFGKWREAA